MARVLKALLNLALQYGEVRPSLVGIARLACACKQTVVNCLKLLSLYGFVIVHRRIKRIRTPLGFKVVQDTNAYTIQEPQGLGAIALRMFQQASESRKWSPSSIDFHPIRRQGQDFRSSGGAGRGFTRLSAGVAGRIGFRALPFRDFPRKCLPFQARERRRLVPFPDTARPPHGAAP